MKSYIILQLMPFLMAFSSGHSLPNQDDIKGKWAFPDSSREIEVYKQNNKFFAKIIKTSGNDDKEKIGHIMIKDMVYDLEKNNYHGEVNSPGGMTASGELKLINENKLRIDVRKFFIHKSYILTRIQ